MTNFRSSRLLNHWTLATLIVVLPATATAQSTADTLYACYVPGSGTVYRVRAANVPPACVDPSHVAFSWGIGAVATETVERVFTVNSDRNMIQDLPVLCPAGTRLIMGGYRFLEIPEMRIDVQLQTQTIFEGVERQFTVGPFAVNAHLRAFGVIGNRPSSGQSWLVQVVNDSGSSLSVAVQAVCGR